MAQLLLKVSGALAIATLSLAAHATEPELEGAAALHPADVEPTADELSHGHVDHSSNADDPITYIDATGGVSSANSDAPMIVCMGVNPWWRLSLFACGTGSNVWREGTGREMSQYLLNYRIARFSFAGFLLEPQVGAGFAELQLGDEPPGFAFGDPQKVQDDNVSTAGGAAAATLRMVKPLPYGFEALGRLTAGAGYFSEAETLYVPQRAFQPFFNFSLGVGY
jgi:hypothetical protein